jgi:glycosyltransferase involved in cell wall biosynthesis
MPLGNDQIRRNTADKVAAGIIASVNYSLIYHFCYFKSSEPLPVMQHEYIKGLVSIGLPTYNRPDSLRRALEIITSQTYSHIEIIVSDNASPDARVSEIVEKFSQRDSRIRYYRQARNTGVLANAGYVLSKSKGEYFTWFSDDDWRSAEFIEIMVAQLENNRSVDLAFCDYREVYEDGSRAAGYPSSHLKVFRPFTSRRRLVRTLSFYWQNAVRGKCNIFYAVFRKAAIDALDLSKLSGAYRYLNMDCLIVFSLLQAGPVSISSEVMCTLTCRNKKYYASDKARPGESSRSVLKKLAHLYAEHKEDRDRYITNATLFAEKVFIYLAFVPKVLVLLAELTLKKAKSGAERSGVPEGTPIHAGRMKGHQDNKKLKLPHVTLVAMATRNVEETLQALIYSCRGVEFGSVKLLSHYSPYGLGKNIEFARIDKIRDIDEWSYKIVYDLHQHVDSDYALLVHADGFVVNPSSWRDEFLDYDYIGAPWPLPTDDFSYRDTAGNIVRVGNSVSLRSKQLLELPQKMNFPWEPYHGFYNEDGFLCVKNKLLLESLGLKFAPLDVAKYFSHESMIPEVRGIKPFAFHKWTGSNNIYPKF